MTEATGKVFLDVIVGFSVKQPQIRITKGGCFNGETDCLDRCDKINPKCECHLLAVVQIKEEGN